MAITVNGAVLRNMPEQISKNVEDIADLQTASTDHESRISDLENDIISSITFNNMSTTGNTVLGDGSGDTTTIHGTLQHTDGNAEFGGNVEVDGILTVNSAADLNNDLDVAGDASVSGALSVTGNAAVGGNLSVTGNAQIFENITDSNGHRRFIEDTIVNYPPTGMTISYARWSLSGTHLVIVLAGEVANGSTISDGTTLATINNLPSWVLDKIYPVFASTRIEMKTIELRASDWSAQTMNVLFTKSTYNDLRISVVAGGITLTADRGFRIQFDLLIDNA